MMRTNDIEHLLVRLGLPIPVGITRAIEAREKGVDAAEVEKRVRELVAKGEPLDLASRRVPQRLQDDLARLVEVAILESARELLELKRAATFALFEQSRALGGDVPTTAEAAVYAGPELLAKFQQRQEQARRYGQLYRLHELLLAGDDSVRLMAVNPTAWQLFSDTKAWPEPPEGLKPPSIAFGPHDKPFTEALPIRLEFLTHHAEFWQPDAEECAAYWLQYCGDVRNSKKPAAAVTAL